MSGEAIVKKTSDELAAERTELAIQRTSLASDRTLMAWVRTATSLISFGFTIYKFFSELKREGGMEEHHSWFSPRKVGMMLIFFGFLGLFFGLLQYRNEIRNLKKSDPELSRSFSPILAILILVLGLILFFAALFRQ